VEILRGLMDTDGWVSNNFKKCRIQHYTTSIKLAEDLKFLIQSLGGISHVRKRSFVDNEQHLYKGKVIRHVKSLYVSEILMPEGLNPFKCSKKANLYNKQPRAKRLISKIDYVGKLPCQCISVDSQDSLYLTENFLVTHNTFYNSVCILDEAQNCKEEQIKMFLTRLGDNSKMIITGDPTQSDLVHNRSLTDIINCMKTVPGIGIVEFNEDSIVRHPLVAGILKAWPK
jgi:phosphate starvation-inducible PhoH-like protein